MRVVVDKIKENREELVKLEILDIGKILEEFYVDMDDIYNVFMYFVGLVDKDGGEIINLFIFNVESKVVKEFVGVVI